MFSVQHVGLWQRFWKRRLSMVAELGADNIHEGMLWHATGDKDPTSLVMRGDTSTGSSMVVSAMGVLRGSCVASRQHEGVG